MAFIKLETVACSWIDNRNCYYSHAKPIILNTSEILSVYPIRQNPSLNDESKKKYESLFDLPVSELCVFRINLKHKEAYASNSSYDVIGPYKKFEDFKNNN